MKRTIIAGLALGFLSACDAGREVACWTNPNGHKVCLCRSPGGVLGPCPVLAPSPAPAPEEAPDCKNPDWPC